MDLVQPRQPGADKRGMHPRVGHQQGIGRGRLIRVVVLAGAEDIDRVRHRILDPLAVVIELDLSPPRHVKAIGHPPVARHGPPRSGDLVLAIVAHPGRQAAPIRQGDKPVQTPPVAVVGIVRFVVVFALVNHAVVVQVNAIDKFLRVRVVEQKRLLKIGHPIGVFVVVRDVVVVLVQPGEDARFGLRAVGIIAQIVVGVAVVVVVVIDERELGQHLLVLAFAAQVRVEPHPTAPTVVPAAVARSEVEELPAHFPATHILERVDVPRGRPLLVAPAAQHRETAVEQVALVFAAHLQADKRGRRVKAENRLAGSKAVLKFHDPAVGKIAHLARCPHPRLKGRGARGELVAQRVEKGVLLRHLNAVIIGH